MSRIWIINQYASTPETGMGGRHHYLAEGLSKLGHDVTVIAAQWHHLLRFDASENLPGIEQRQNYLFARVPVPRYAHAHDKKRVLNWLLFGRRLRDLPKRLDEHPDVILYSSLSLLGFPGAERLAKKLGARLVFEVRDIWPLSLVEIGGQSTRHPLVRWMQYVEDRAYRVSDAVVSNLPNAVEHMESRGMDRVKFNWIPNGFSLDEIENTEPLSDDVQRQLPAGKFIVGYTGSIGKANSLDTMVEAAAKLRDHKNLAFVIVGHGQERDRIVRKIDDLGLTNITVIGTIPKRQVQSVLAHFDACYIGLTRDPLFRFGVSPNKLFDYLISSKPILYGIDSGNYRPVEQIGAGFNVAPEDPDALADAVLKLMRLTPEERAQMGERGRRVALEDYEYDKLAKKMEGVLVP